MKQSENSVALAVVPPTTDPGLTSYAPEPPSHLSADAAAWWRDVVKEFQLEPHHLRLLQTACESWDRSQQARQAIADHGSLTFTDERGVIRAHPAVAMERDATIRFARLVRELDLDCGPPSEARRPPAIPSNRREQ